MSNFLFILETEYTHKKNWTDEQGQINIMQNQFQISTKQMPYREVRWRMIMKVSLRKLSFNKTLYNGKIKQERVGFFWLRNYNCK